MTSTKEQCREKRVPVKHPGPRGTSYACPFCKFYLFIPRGPGQGRGHGLRTGGAAYSKVAAHIRAEHPETGDA